MRAVLIGAVESTRIAARCLAAAPEWDLAGIVTLPLDLAGRHSDFIDLTPDAAAANSQIIHAANANDDDILDAIAALKPDYIFVIGWSQLCGEKMMALTPGRVVGYHPAPLPRLRGRGVIPWTILLNEPITASTLFLIDAGTDSGPILAQDFFHVAADETASSLYAKHMSKLSNMLPDLLAKLAADIAVPQIQDSRYATWAARRRPEDGEIDWADSAMNIWRLVRACGDPYPGAQTTYNGTHLVVAAAELVDLSDHRAAIQGQVVEYKQDGFVVRCGCSDGIYVREWRWNREGRPPLHAKLGPPARNVI